MTVKTKEVCRCPRCRAAHKQRVEPFGAAHLPIDRHGYYLLHCDRCVHERFGWVQVLMDRAIALGLSNN